MKSACRLRSRLVGPAVAVIVILLALPSCSGGEPPDPMAPLDGRGGGLIAFHSSRDGNLEIYVMNADGSGPCRLTNDPAEDSCPNLSPDGSRVVFNSSRDGRSEIYLVRTPSAGSSSGAASPPKPQRLTTTDLWEMQPAWFPDGERIAYVGATSSQSAGDIWVMDATGANARQITYGLAAELPFPTPDGSGIIFSVRTGQGYDLWSMGTDGSDPRPIVATPDRELYGRSSPDGCRVAFCGGAANSRLGLYVMDSDGSNAERLVSPMAEAPCWSPDGTKIAYQSQGTNMEIFVIGADGTGRVNLTQNPANDFWASWAAYPGGTD